MFARIPAKSVHAGDKVRIAVTGGQFVEGEVVERMLNADDSKVVLALDVSDETLPSRYVLDLDEIVTRIPSYL